MPRHPQRGEEVERLFKKEKIKIPMERLDRFFQKGTPSKQIEDTIIKALTFYRQRKRDNRDDR